MSYRDFDLYFCSNRIAVTINPIVYMISDTGFHEAVVQVQNLIQDAHAFAGITKLNLFCLLPAYSGIMNGDVAVMATMRGLRRGEQKVSTPMKTCYHL